MAESTFPESCHCFALRQASRFVTQIYERHLAPIGLTAAQFTILAKISAKPGLGIATLAQAMVMERTTLVRALAPLQRDGLLESEPATTASRAQLYRLSPSGREALAKARVAWRTAQREFETQVGPERAKFLREELFELTRATS